MKIGELTVSYLSHVSFLFRSPQGVDILTDPLFAEGFIWQGHMEHYLSPPGISIEDIASCDAIFVSHIHGDHCDGEAISSIHGRTKARILAPDDVLESLRLTGISDEYLVHIEDSVKVEIDGVGIMPLSGYDNSHDEKGRPNKFSMVIETGNTRLFYSGDCHQVPPGLIGDKVDAIFLWPHPNDKKLIQFRENVEFSKFVLMHGDHFKPGDFLCNLDYAEQKDRVQRLLPGVEVIIPERVKLESA
jgi:L-ascorbate metabolism protein UlaG (beta-lactamase superfamily)